MITVTSIDCFSVHMDIWLEKLWTYPLILNKSMAWKYLNLFGIFIQNNISLPQIQSETKTLHWFCLKANPFNDREQKGLQQCLDRPIISQACKRLYIFRVIFHFYLISWVEQYCFERVFLSRSTFSSLLFSHFRQKKNVTVCWSCLEFV